MNEDIIKGVAVAVIMTISCITDIRARRIPNALTLPFVCISVIYAIVNYSSKNIILCFVVSTLFFVIGLYECIGAGDAKLLIGLTFFCGWQISSVGAYIALCVFTLVEFIKAPREVVGKLKNALAGKIKGENAILKKAFAPYIAIGISTVYTITVLERIL